SAPMTPPAAPSIATSAENRLATSQLAAPVACMIAISSRRSSTVVAITLHTVKAAETSAAAQISSIRPRTLLRTLPSLSATRQMGLAIVMGSASWIWYAMELMYGVQDQRSYSAGVIFFGSLTAKASSGLVSAPTCTAS